MSGSEQAGEGIDFLWLDYLEGELDESGMASLRRSFEAQPDARPARVEALRLHRELGLTLSATARERAEFVAATMARLPAERSQRSPALGRPRATGTALAAAILAAVLLTLPGAEPARVLRVVEAAGPVEWVSGGGQAEALPGPGSLLPGGVLALHSPEAWAKLAFDDGSTFTLTGIARATVSDEGQKVIALDGGGLIAEVQPQQGEPMLVFTAAAEIEVVGTRFRVQASEERATLDVAGGRVAMVRHADGERVEVAAGEFAVATRFASDAFRAGARRRPTGSWSAKLESDPTQGKFVDDTAALKADLARAVERGDLTEAEALDRFLADSGGLEAVALWKKAARWKKLASKRRGTSASGGASRGLVAGGPVSAGGDSAPVLLMDESRILVAGWVARPTRLTVGLTLAHGDRRYAGKVSTTSEVLPGGASFELEVRGEDFESLEAAAGTELEAGPAATVPGQPSAGGIIIEDWWCIGHDLDSGLKIRRVEVQDGGTPSGSGR